MSPNPRRVVVPVTGAEAVPLPSYLPAGHYADLKRRIMKAGLLEPQPLYYTGKVAATICLAIPALILLLATHTLWLQALNAVYLAAVFAQFSFIGHDVGHRQVIHSGRLCSALELIFGNLLVGVSSTWWMTKHNQHHSHPNRPDYDPDVMLPVFAFSAGRARQMNRAQRFMVRHQHILFVILLLLEAIVLRVSSIQFLVVERGRRWLLEFALIVLHLVVYGWLIFHLLGLYPAIIFIVIHQMAFGLYMGSVFAPNHKGMMVIEDDGNTDFLLEQVLTSRNVNPSSAIDFFFGGLNYQIEHHLFPSMPRNRLHMAQRIVETFCAERSIPYCQTSLLRAYGDILSHLHTVGTSARGSETAKIA